jgi:hypothetical protein
VALPGGLLAALLSEGASAAVPQRLVRPTVQAALAAGQGTATGLASAQAAVLAERVMRAMLITKIKIATVLLLFAAGLTALGGGLLLRFAAAGEPHARPAAAPKRTAGPRAGTRHVRPAERKGDAEQPEGKAKARPEKEKDPPKEKAAQKNEELLAVLFEAVKDKDRDIKQTALNTLLALGREAVPGFVRLAKGEDPTLRRLALTCLGTLAPKTPAAGKALDELFKDEQFLEKALHGTDEAFQRAALLVVSRKGRKGVPVLVKLLKGKDKGLRQKAIGLLRNLGAEARDAVPTLLQMYKAEKTLEERRLLLKTISHIVGAPPKFRMSVEFRMP